jgi:hypothetical protein
VPQVDVPIEALAELSCEPYLVHLALIAIFYQEHLDDTPFLSGHKPNRPDLVAFANRLHNHGRILTRPEWRMDSGKFNPLVGGPFVLNFEKDLLPNFVLYYSSFFTDLALLREARPDAVRFAETMIAQLNTTDPVVKPISLAYFNTHKPLLAPGSGKTGWDTNNPDPVSRAVILRTWQLWCVRLMRFPEKLREFVGDRTPAFG